MDSLSRKIANARQISLIEGVTESMFVLLPILVLTFALIVKKEPMNVIGLSEWAFAAAILFGQSLVRLIGIASYGRTKSHVVRFLGTLILVAGLFPALLVLTTKLLIDNIPIWIDIFSILLFVLGIGVLLWSRRFDAGINPDKFLSSD